MPSLHVVTRVSAKPESAGALEKILRDLVAPSRQEEGCERYELFQDPTQPAHYLLLEAWSSEATFDAHFGSARIRAVLEKVGPMLAEPPGMSRWQQLA